MSITIIWREYSKDRDRRIYETGRRHHYNMPMEGVTRSVDEAHDIDYHRHGELQGPLLVEGDVPEMKQAHEDDMHRLSQISGQTIDSDDRYRRWQQEERERRK